MSRNDRKISNFLLTHKFQLKLTFYYIGVGVSIIAVTAGTVFYNMTLVRELMNNSVMTDFSSQSRITEYMFQVGQISMLGFSAFAIASFIFSLMISHRIAGPMVAIVAFIHELKKANLSYGRTLRPNDELTVIMDELHLLQAALKQQEQNV